MLALVELQTATLDYGIPGITQTRMLLIFLIMLAISMIPYFFLYLSLREQPAGAQVSPRHSGIAEFARRMAEWAHTHRHPVLHH